MTCVVIGSLCLVEVLQSGGWNFGIQRWEWIIYDSLMQSTANKRQDDGSVAKLGFVEIRDESILSIADGSLGFQFGLYWPRHLYAKLLDELSAEGAKTVAFDVLFAEPRADHARIKLANGDVVPSDEAFAQSLTTSGIGILAASEDVIPDDLFLSTKVPIGDISAVKDADGVLRRAKPYNDHQRIWHRAIRQHAAIQSLALTKAKLSNDGITIPHLGSEPGFLIRLDSEGRFNPADLDQNGSPAKPFKTLRIWHMGIMLAARSLGLDLEKAELIGQRLTIPGTNGISRTIPLDEDGFFLIDWKTRHGDTNLTTLSFEQLLGRNILRREEPQENTFSNKMVIVGSTATGNDLTDRGATPLSKDTYLVSKHWNVAAMVIGDRFIRTAPLWLKILVILLLGTASAALTWNLRTLQASLSVGVLLFTYALLTYLLFSTQLFLIPFMMPAVGGLLINHGLLVTYRARLDQNEKRRVKDVFSKIVSPNIVHELLKSDTVELGGTRRKVSVYFADVRGFTAFMDARERQTDNHIQRTGLAGMEADLFRDQAADTNLRTINGYLATIADNVKKHQGTLDKYMGDCVMAFWGAPIEDKHHALRSVLAAIESQQAIELLNVQSSRDNEQREKENPGRIARGEPPFEKLPEISLGTGINTGFVTVGLMGSDQHVLNYTVFGGEVNLASRLEGFSGRGRIIIGEGTYKELEELAPDLANVCNPLEVTGLKGFSSGLKGYEVPWRTISPDLVSRYQGF